MAYAKKAHVRSTAEKLFLFFFVPTILVGYSLYKCAVVYVYFGLFDDVTDTYILGKHPSFWYVLLYSTIVCGLAGRVLWRGRSPYKNKKHAALSRYQRAKFATIFLVQLFLIFLLPFVLFPLWQGRPFFQDEVAPTQLDAFVYVSKAFTSWGGIAYLFVLVPISVRFFGKRFCSWFCACGNLAETVGTTAWGKAWVAHKTPTGRTAKRLEKLQTVLLVLGLAYGFLLFLDMLKVFTAGSLLEAGRLYQDFAVDFMFGAVIGIGAYPFFGTRIWCRYGCPLAKGMELFGRHAGSRFAVAGNERCKGLGLCSQACPMGIDVASYVSEGRKPTLGSFGLDTTPCIGCGGCIAVCPVDGIAFKPLKAPVGVAVDPERVRS